VRRVHVGGRRRGETHSAHARERVFALARCVAVLSHALCRVHGPSCYASLSDNERNEMRELVLPGLYVRLSVCIRWLLAASGSSAATRNVTESKPRINCPRTFPHPTPSLSLSLSRDVWINSGFSAVLRNSREKSDQAR